MNVINRGFRRRQRIEAPADRVPPGQYVTADFPVLSAGPTPRVRLGDWRFIVTGSDGTQTTWTWDEFRSLPSETITVDIHCVTKWSKLDTEWEGVSLDTLFSGIGELPAYALIHSYGGYTTNLPTADITGGKAWIAFAFDGEPLDPVHGGPARLLVPHLYFWKSAKWVNEVSLAVTDRRGFWESYGYNNYGDPWLEQRYEGD